MTHLKNSEPPFFYSSYYLKQEATKNFFHLPLNDIEKLGCAAAENKKNILEKISRALHKSPRNYQLLLLAAESYYLQFRTTEFKRALEQIRLPWFAPRGLKADYLRLTAINELYLTDMLRASNACSQALKLYQKLKFSYEEAESYLTMAQIYRISGIYDVAFSMLKEAEKIFTELELTAKIAETKAYFGLLESGRENYQPALEYLKSAEELCLQHKLQKTGADIKNWQGQVYYLIKKQALALKCFASVLKTTAARPTAKAFASEMTARIERRRGHYSSALKAAETALQIHQEANCRPGIFENLYLKAEIHYDAEEFAQSEKILNQLIKEKTPAGTIYYPANAYTLLGLIYLKQQRLSLAKTLFKQALDLENSQNRIKGAVIDYNNLAVASFMEGDKTTGENYLRQALSYAENLEDSELKDYLKTKLCF